MGPSLFPALLSLYWIFLAPHLEWLQILIALVIGLAPPLACLWMQTLVATPLAFCIALAFGACYAFIVQGNSIMTESVFCPMLYGALWLTARGGAEAGRAAPRTASWTAALLWVAMARTRVAGWFFLGAFAWIAARRGWKALALVALGLAAAWSALERVLASGVRAHGYTAGVFTVQYPILTDPIRGAKALAANFADNLWNFAGAIYAHLLFPWIYEAFSMGKAKRALCLAVFLISAWGLLLRIRRHPALRPWIAAVAASLLPTFLIFQPHDNFRYLMPLFPFLALCFLAPFEASATVTAGWRKAMPLAMAALLAAGQAAASLSHDFETEFIDYPREYAAIHDSLLAMPTRPDLCLAPDFHYTYLRTGIKTLHMESRHKLVYVQPLARGKEAWAICGPRNEYFCRAWEARGVAYDTLKRAGTWSLLRIAKWPEE